MRQKSKKVIKKKIRLNSLKQINLNAAGLDIGDEEIYACVPEESTAENVRCFKTFTVDLKELADWLGECGVTTVALESTGVYWIPIYEILAARGFEVCLVNARHIKNVTGRKTDVLDCQWVQQLHTYGLLQGSFRPTDDILALRAIVRHRHELITTRSSHIQRMQKSLQQMNIKLTNVVTDITGLTGLTIIRDIVAGEEDPQKLALHRHPNCKKSLQDIAKALAGNYRSEHIFTLKQSLEFFDFYTAQIRACDDQIEAYYSTFTPQVDLAQTPLPPPRQKRSKPKGNEPLFDLRTQLYLMSGVDLTQIDGINVLTAQVIMSEIGLDLSKWPTVKHFSSWLRLCPNNKITGGKVIRRGRLKSHNRAAQALQLAAVSLSHSKSVLGAFYRRMRAKHGPQIANVATAHKLARIIYFMLKDKTPYRRLDPDLYEAQLLERKVAQVKQLAHRLGFRLEPHPQLTMTVS
jgi:transposase